MEAAEPLCTNELPLCCHLASADCHCYRAVPGILLGGRPRYQLVGYIHGAVQRSAPVDVIVQPDFRRREIGGALLERLFEIARVVNSLLQVSLMDDPPLARPRDTWASGTAYEPYVGRWSRLVAREFLDWLGVAPGGRWLDVGCGTGALSQTLLEVTAPAHVKGIDRSEEFITYAQAHVQDQRARFTVGDALALPDQPASYDAAISGLMLNFLPQPERAVREMMRVVRPGGIVAAYVWDYAGGMQLMRHFWNAAVALDPDAYDLDEGRRFPLCQPAPLAELFQQASLSQVELRAIDIATNFQDFDDYWSPFLGGQGPAPSYVMALSDERRAALRERIRVGLPFALDGSIPLVARAWAVRGRCP